MVLDEATAFADPENEHQIQKAFETLTRNKTVLMIAHRLSTVQNADNIIVFNEGEDRGAGQPQRPSWRKTASTPPCGRTISAAPMEGRKGGSGMIRKLQHVFALSEKGAKDLVKAVIWCFVCNLALMFPVGAVLFTLQHLLGCLEGGGSPTDGFWLYAGFALAVLVLLFVLHWFQYASLYLATYRESANRRVSSGGDAAQAPPVLFREPGSQRPDLHHDRRLLQPGPDVLPLCAPAVRLHRLHTGDRGVHVLLRLAHGPGGAVGGACGGGADGGLQKDSGRLRNEKHPE